MGEVSCREHAELPPSRRRMAKQNFGTDRGHVACGGKIQRLSLLGVVGVSMAEC